MGLARQGEKSSGKPAANVANAGAGPKTGIAAEQVEAAVTAMGV